jgi:hypothetical protein
VNTPSARTAAPAWGWFVLSYCLFLLLVIG